jgi:hypothetical protein
MKHTALILTGALGLSAVVAHAATPVNWPQFRGGNASGVADGSNLPTTWSTGGRHRKNTYASETPATDGERLYASFGGNVGLFCLALDGSVLWRRTWEPQSIYLDFGTASSPVVHGGRVYVLRDSEGESFLTALDAKTGDIAWTTPPHRSRREKQIRLGDAVYLGDAPHRDRHRRQRHGRQLRPRWQARLWRLRGMTQATPSPTPAAACSTSAPARRAKPTARSSPSSPARAATSRCRQGRNLRPVRRVVPAARHALHGLAAVLSRAALLDQRHGMMQVFEAATGREIYRERVGRMANTFRVLRSRAPAASTR